MADLVQRLELCCISLGFYFSMGVLNESSVIMQEHYLNRLRILVPEFA